MSDLLALAGITGALAVGVVSPGPSFVLIARTAVGSSRAEAVSAALGMGIGGVVFAVAALVGLQGLLRTVPSLYLALKLAGGLYLIWLGARIWRGAAQPLAATAASRRARPRSLARALVVGLGTQVSNPKTAIVYASVFAAFLPAAATLEFGAAIVVLVFVIESGWYALVALALSADGPRATYLRCKAGADRLAGGVMVALGLKLAASATPA